jgi:hypothetical protein
VNACCVRASSLSARIATLRCERISLEQPHLPGPLIAELRPLSCSSVRSAFSASALRLELGERVLAREPGLRELRELVAIGRDDAKEVVHAAPEIGRVLCAEDEAGESTPLELVESCEAHHDDALERTGDGVRAGRGVLVGAALGLECLEPVRQPVELGAHVFELLVASRSTARGSRVLPAPHVLERLARIDTGSDDVRHLFARVTRRALLGGERARPFGHLGPREEPQEEDHGALARNRNAAAPDATLPTMAPAATSPRR